MFRILVRYLILTLLGFLWLPALADHPNIFFTPNQGQWDERIRYSLKLLNGNMYLENGGLSYFFVQGENHHHTAEVPEEWQAHSVKVDFIGALPQPVLRTGNLTPFYYNYFIGSDPSRWKSEIRSAYSVRYENLYDRIDLEFYGTPEEQLKYDYHVRPGGDPAAIRLRYRGADRLFVAENGDLHVQTSLGTIIEKRPVAFQETPAGKKEVLCRYRLQGNELSFDFPRGYDARYTLVIDPVLVFSSFTGSTADNFGFTATYDYEKNTFGGGIVYPGGQYPVTAGAFQTSFNGTLSSSTRDVGISKFNADGSTLLYSTYLGGTGMDAPHSLVVNRQGELYVMGTTGSTNFPIPTGGYSNTFRGGSSASPPASGTTYSSGSDIFIARFNPQGTVLMGATYMGGSGNDGLNLSLTLSYNYGDPFRGEIIIDHQGNCVVSSVTASPNFPQVNPTQASYGGGGYDACVFKLDASLSNLLWSTFLGGSGDDSAYGIQIDSNGDMYVAGGTASSNFPVTSAVVKPSYGGAIDGYIARFAAAGGTMIASTFLGTGAYDQCYFVQLDTDDNVYVVGQTTGTYPIMPASVYNVPNSGQFIHKLDNMLSTTLFSTTVGRGAGTVDISPSAFLVNDCGLIYLAGWGGNLNGMSPYHATSSTTQGLPVTPDALQSTTDGKDFYLMILQKDAAGLMYATFFGASTGSSGLGGEHVDGGTSRFDKDGVVYQAVCAGCGGLSFPTTPGVWSTTNNSSNCNLAVFKIDLKEVIALAGVVAPDGICTLPADFVFQNHSVGATNYLWDFGDGNTSTVYNPTHSYADTGRYIITLVALDTTADCIASDTLFLEVYVPGPLTVTYTPGDTICVGESLSFNLSGGQTYQWSPPDYLSTTTGPNPVATPPQTTTYTVVATDAYGCRDTAAIEVVVKPYTEAEFSVHFTPCTFPAVVSFENESEHAVHYFWDFGNGFTSTEPELQQIYTEPGYYTITLVAIDSSSCNGADTMQFEIFLPPPASVSVSGSDTICLGQQLLLQAAGGVSYSWSPPYGLSDPYSPSPWANPEMGTTYTVIATDSNGCADTATVFIEVFPPASIDAGPDGIADIGRTPVLNPYIPPGGSFYWTPTEGLSCVTCLSPQANPEFNTTYYLHYTDPYGCTYIDSMQVLVSPSVFIPNAFTPNGDGLNDVFFPQVRNLSHYEFFVFNRWGELIFTSTTAGDGWDGTIKGRQAPLDVYVWRIDYSDFIEPGITRTKRGHVTLVR